MKMVMNRVAFVTTSHQHRGCDTVIDADIIGISIVAGVWGEGSTGYRTESCWDSGTRKSENSQSKGSNTGSG